MKKYILPLLITILSCKKISTENNQITAYTNKKGHLIGLVNKKILLQNTKMKECFMQYYEDYIPDQKTIKQINKNLKGLTVISYLGTWCSDSRIQIPIFLKIIDNTKLNKSKSKIISLNRAKKAKGLEKNYKIKKVPTFIIFKNNKEIGRIIEHPRANSTLEDDLLSIITK